MDQQNSIIKNIIIDSFFILEEEFAYSFEIVEDSNSIFEKDFTIRYSNEIHRREINVSTTLGTIKNGSVYTISISIIRIPYSGIKDMFDLSCYLQSKGEDIPIRFNIEFTKQEVKLKVNKLVEALILHCGEIVKGNLWLETFYPKW